MKNRCTHFQSLNISWFPFIRIYLFFLILSSSNVIAQKADFITYRKEENGIIVGDMTYGTRENGTIDCDEWIKKFNKKNKTNYIVYVRPDLRYPKAKNTIGILPAEDKERLENLFYKSLTNKEATNASSLDHYLSTHQDGVHYNEIKALEPELRLVEKAQQSAWANAKDKSEAIARCDAYLTKFPKGYYSDEVRMIRLYHYSIMIRGGLKYYRGSGEYDDYNANYLSFKNIFESAIDKATKEEKPILVFLLTTYSEETLDLSKHFKDTRIYANLNANYICILATNEDPQTSEYLKSKLNIDITDRKSRCLVFSSNGKLLENLNYISSLEGVTGVKAFGYSTNDFIDLFKANLVNIKTLTNVFEMTEFELIRKYLFKNGFVYYYDDHLEQDVAAKTEYSDSFTRPIVLENIQIIKFKGGVKYLFYGTVSKASVYSILESCITNSVQRNIAAEKLVKTGKLDKVETIINGIVYFLEFTIVPSEKDKNIPYCTVKIYK